MAHRPRCYLENLDELPQYNDYTREQEIHHFATLVVGTVAILLNILLLLLLQRLRSVLPLMRPLFLSTAILDLAIAVLFVVTQPFPILSYGRLLQFFASEIQFQNPTVNRCLSVAVNSICTWGWTTIPMHFAYRLQIVRRGKRPSAAAFVVFASVTLALLGLCVWSSFFAFGQISEEERRDAVRIAESLGFRVREDAVFGTSNLEAIVRYRRDAVFYPTMIGVVFSISVQVYIIWFLHTKATALSAAKRRLNCELNVGMLMMGVTPVLINVVPAAIGHYMGKCVQIPEFVLFHAVTPLVQPIMSPLTTILFAAPYRRTAWRWLRYGRGPWAVQAAWTTAGERNPTVFAHRTL